MNSLEKIFGKGASWESPHVQQEMKNMATAIYHAAMAGDKIPPAAMRAAEVVMSRGILKSEGPKTLNVFVSETKMLEAKRKAGLLPSP